MHHQAGMVSALDGERRTGQNGPQAFRAYGAVDGCSPMQRHLSNPFARRQPKVPSTGSERAVKTSRRRIPLTCCVCWYAHGLGSIDVRHTDSGFSGELATQWATFTHHSKDSPCGAIRRRLSWC